MYQNNVFKIIKDYIKPLDVARKYLGEGKYSYGVLWYKSPFRNEKTASFCFNNKKGIHDFGINKHYDIISFVEELFNLKTIEAVNRLIIDFSLPIEPIGKNENIPDFEYNKKAAEYQKQKKQEEELKRKKEIYYDEIYNVFCALYKEWNKLLFDSKNWDIDIFGNELSIIYKNTIFYESIVDYIRENSIDTIYELKNNLNKLLEV